MEHGVLLIALGVLFLAGLALDTFGRIVHIPRVTLLILLGALVGPPVLDILPEALSNADGIYADTALTMVAFLLGGSLSPDTLRAHGREILIISVTVVFVSVVLVTGSLILAGVPVALAVLLGGISSATAPAATLDVIRQSGSSGRFARNLLGIVAIDDAWGLLAFSATLTLAGTLTVAGAIAGPGGASPLLHGVWEAGGAIIVGLAIGLPASYLTGRLKPGEPTLLEALGVVFLCAGFAIYFNVSFLLTGMVCGATVVNLARHHDQPFHEIERIEWPFLLLFFVMAGASLDLAMLEQIGWIGLIYVAARIVARMIGGLVGGKLAGLPPRESALTGMALMPQAGVAIGMALVASDRLPQYADQVLAITIASTIIFEIIGPFFTQFAIKSADRADARAAESS